MSVPVAIPLAWTSHRRFFLQSVRFSFGFGSDCLRHQDFIR